ncbi:sigma-70 family RNA polymerase sigma factor [Chitinophaga rhizophila]|uniref:Sigma-70 family RNA polymerase sigma factor n=1 Tax=Chitinophaga rhizophila TaxID=2866212 RepID=A0ABS7G5M8_9BACT|nr:sigma-70 family RNA polymerase sigma factor [Chitinophaga rhizophila]MBW8682945.1 sigma-70 family RNA polymerase sigma factor [Chitinophaga rhizophila]
MRIKATYNPSSDPEMYFDRLFKDTYSNTIAYLEKISGDRDLAGDLAQEAYLKVWQKLDLLPQAEEETLRYILIIARNCFLDHLKSVLKEKKRQDAYAVVYTETSAAVNLMEVKEQQQIIDHTINTQEEAARRFYLLNREEGLTYKEIARQEGVSEKTVERYIGRVLQSLRTRLAGFLFLW